MSTFQLAEEVADIRAELRQINDASDCVADAVNCSPLDAEDGLEAAERLVKAAARIKASFDAIRRYAPSGV